MNIDFLSDNKNTKSLLVVGSANLDIFMKVNNPPEKGETISASGLEQSIGGKGCNTAISIGKLGYNIEFFGQIGNDSAGKLILKSLNDSSVNHNNVKVLQDNVSGQAYILSYPDGNNSIVIVGGANTNWDINLNNNEISNKLNNSIKKSNFLLLQREIPEEINILSAKIAFENNIPVMLDVGGQDTELSSELLSYVSILSPNETELNRICNKKIDYNNNEILIEACNTLRKKGDNKNLEFLIKLGSKGCKFIDKSNKVIHQKAIAIKDYKIIDTTGAGDCFTGSFAASYINNNFNNIEYCLKFAAACAFKSITRYGAANSMPTKSEAIEIFKLVVD